MHALLIAWNLIRIPRLFGALFLVPTLISVVLIYVQLHLTEFALATLRRDPLANKEQAQAKREANVNVLRRVLLNIKEPLPDILICRWPADEPQQPAPCPLEPYDVVLKVTDPLTYDPAPYVRLFNRNFRRLHLCTSCESKINIDASNAVIESHAHNVWALALLSLLEFSQEGVERYFEMLQDVVRVHDLTGSIFLHAHGFQQPVPVDDLAQSLSAIASFAMIIVVALWLAVRAHRRILDYFSKSGALLPLVAATGKRDFYTALWLLTAARVGLFVGGAIPLTLISLNRLTHHSLRQVFFNGDLSALFLWLITLTSSLLLATLVASIADLRHRFSITAIFYRYVPLTIALIGGLLWGLSFLFPDEIVHQFRVILAALPLAGITPILLAPIFTPDYGVLVTHALLSSAILAVVGRANIRWFAAHLEQL